MCYHLDECVEQVEQSLQWLQRKQQKVTNQTLVQYICCYLKGAFL